MDRVVFSGGGPGCFTTGTEPRLAAEAFPLLGPEETQSARLGGPSRVSTGKHCCSEDEMTRFQTEETASC